MAATRINVNVVLSVLSRTETELSYQLSKLDMIEKRINTMSAIWASEDQRVYAASFQDRKKTIEKYIQSINDYLNFIKDYVYECSFVDRSVANALNNISI